MLATVASSIDALIEELRFFLFGGGRDIVAARGTGDGLDGLDGLNGLNGLDGRDGMVVGRKC